MTSSWQRALVFIQFSADYWLHDVQYCASTMFLWAGSGIFETIRTSIRMRIANVTVLNSQVHTMLCQSCVILIFVWKLLWQTLRCCGTAVKTGARNPEVYLRLSNAIIWKVDWQFEINSILWGLRRSSVCHICHGHRQISRSRLWYCNSATFLASSDSCAAGMKKYGQRLGCPARSGCLSLKFLGVAVASLGGVLELLLRWISELFDNFR